MRLEKKIDKDFYSTQDLVEQPWFPIYSTLTIKRLIKSGKLYAIDISTTRYHRWKISKESVIDFIRNNENAKPKKSKKKKSKKK